MSTIPVTLDPRIVSLPSAEIRRRFVEFFAERGHTPVPSASLVPAGDKTLLFANSGMVQFKDVLTGVETRSYTRAVDYQRCLRVAGKHNDFDEVGRTPRHHTLFEMLGNWSFGDYFKREAIRWAWEFLTRDLGIPEERLAVTTYKDDEVARAVWRDEIGIPPERMATWGNVDAGDDHNFWRMAETGPCGPCSEIHFDRGAHLSEGPHCTPDHSETCPRWLEFWNLVFMEFDQRPDGRVPLPFPSVDTGMGLERLASILQQVPTNYDTDLFLPIHEAVRQMIGHDMEDFEALRFQYQVVADHVRAITFLVADVVPPGADPRGSITRKLVKRAVRYGREIGFLDPFLGRLTNVVVDTMSEAYPYLVPLRQQIEATVQREERSFERKVDAGVDRVADFAATVPREVTSGPSRTQLLTQLSSLQRDLLRYTTAAELQASQQTSIQRFRDALRTIQSAPPEVLAAYSTPTQISKMLADLQRHNSAADLLAAQQSSIQRFQEVLSRIRAMTPEVLEAYSSITYLSKLQADLRRYNAANDALAAQHSKIEAFVNHVAARGLDAAVPDAVQVIESVAPVVANAATESGVAARLARSLSQIPLTAGGDDDNPLELFERVVGGYLPGQRLPGRRPEELVPSDPELPGDLAFKLHDTYGFPIELAIELAAEYGLRVDLDGFERAMAQQRERSRSGKKAELAKHAESSSLYNAIQGRAGDTEFLGYETTTADGRVVAIIRDGMEYDELTGHGEAEVVLGRTPFYAEGGGQVGDQGTIRESGGGSELFTVSDTQRPVAGLIVHRGMLHGRLRVGETVQAAVDAERRAHTMRNHTGTHLLHRALRNVVGDGARQAGSLVTPDYLRFDYPSDRALTDDEKRAIEDEVRGIVRDDRPVTIAFLPMGDAIEQGADAFFDEKYGETVRTIRVQEYSFELCGGTHARATGQIGGFVITGERSIGSGMRRIEALTGAAADRLARERIETLERVASAVGAQTIDAVEDRIAALQAELRETKRRLKSGAAPGLPQPAELAAKAEEVAPGVRLVAAAIPYESTEALKAAAKAVRAALASGVIALVLDADAPQIFVTVSDDLVARGISAGELVKAAAGPIGAKGGGRPQMAQGMGTDRSGVTEALSSIRGAIVRQLEAA